MNITAISIFNQELSSKATPEHVSLNKSSNPQIKQIIACPDNILSGVQTMIGQFLSFLIILANSVSGMKRFD